MRSLLALSPRRSLLTLALSAVLTVPAIALLGVASASASGPGTSADLALISAEQNQLYYQCWPTQRDRDGDCISNRRDRDIDGDGISNRRDRDVDGDGISNRRDRDVDGDGISNRRDRDIDGDGISNRRDRDMDGDGIANRRDRDR